MSAPKKLRMPNFTESEITALVDGYEENKIAIEAKGDGPHGSQAKRRAWERITATLFAVSGIRREVADVKKKWADYKSANKICGAAVRRSQNATGGGPGEPDLTEAEERVIGLLREDALVGIEGAFDIGVRPARQSGSNDEVGHDILKSQRAILEKLDLLVSAQQGLLATQQQVLVTQQQLVSLKAHKYGVHFDDKSS
ncbi:nuclear apoptosis-inducing factor 1-like [Ixodes scapularis]